MSAPDQSNAVPEQLETPDDSDRDSACRGQSRASSTTTLAPSTSSTYNFRKAHGRTYHNYEGGQYPFPDDEHEKDRLDFQNALFLKRLDGKLFLAPLPETLHNILDIGTGTGIWAIEVAEKYPSACVIGIDLSPIQPTGVPPNCEFQVDDANDEWDFGVDFDLVHCRHLYGAVEEKRSFKQGLAALKPGGWLEITSIAWPLMCNDQTLEGTALMEWQDEIMEASRIVNTPFDNPLHYRQWMEEAGFIHVQEFVQPLPLNMWPKDSKLKKLGQYAMTNFWEGIQGFSATLFIETLGWSDAAVEVFLAGVRNDILDRWIHAYWKVVVVYGQKPSGPTTEHSE